MLHSVKQSEVEAKTLVDLLTNRSKRRCNCDDLPSIGLRSSLGECKTLTKASMYGVFPLLNFISELRNLQAWIQHIKGLHMRVTSLLITRDKAVNPMPELQLEVVCSKSSILLAQSLTTQSSFPYIGHWFVVALFGSPSVSFCLIHQLHSCRKWRVHRLGFENQSHRQRSEGDHQREGRDDPRRLVVLVFCHFIAVGGQVGNKTRQDEQGS